MVEFGLTPQQSEPDESIVTEFRNALRLTGLALNGITEGDWQVLAEVLRSESGKVPSYGAFQLLQTRVAWAFDSIDSSLTGHAYEFLTLIGDPSLSTSLDPFRSELSELTVSSVTFLNAVHGDWISDLLLAKGTGFLDWRSLSARPVVFGTGISAERLISIQIRRQDEEVLRLEMTPRSLLSFVGRLITEAIDLPEQHLGEVGNDIWERLAEPVATLNQLVLANRATATDTDKDTNTEH